MERNAESGESRQSGTDESGFDYYLPGTPTVSSDPGRIERFVTRLFRRRGGLRPIVRRRE